MEEKSRGYSPQETEKHWYQWWEKQGFFTPDPNNPNEHYCIVIPPPNVTGSLHMGHGLNNTLQDILIRYYRMLGRKTLWLPGMDHAGIATQYVVERELKKENTSRYDLGREKFLERVWQWVDSSGGIILRQLRKLGCSCDWTRQRFTMDEGLSRAVREVFVTLWEQGLIYRGKRLINWCPDCHTALSDLEVTLPKDAKIGKLWHLRYPFKDTTNYIEVATTRPETMFGDTAIAVNPDDDRYRHLVGKKVLVPFINREIPIIADPQVTVEFGTGALKITPAHDFDDFDIGQRHKLEMISIMDSNAVLNEHTGPFNGMDRYAAREKVLEELDRMGLLGPTEDYPVRIGRCYRCRTEIEPMLSHQWFVRMQGLADRAIEAVRKGETEIVPEIWEKNYFEWLANIRDWCISRQIWWGHQIPAWYCAKCGEITVSRKDPTECSHCNSAELTRETDVLDTWFSSALWPFSTLGWPEQTEDLRAYYPTTCLVTGFDILFFWVARMMMMGLHFMGKAPFRHVYIHALVRDEYGKKMSKSTGNVIDPLEVIDKFGADAFRFTLAAFAAQGRDIKMSESRIEGYRHFCNKIWQASHGVALKNIEGFEYEKAKNLPRSLEERWIISRLGLTTGKVREAIETYKFNEAASAIYHFIWLEFCDWFIEISKPAIYGKDQDVKNAYLRTLLEVLEGMLRLLHPIMPFISEDIWQKLPIPKPSKSIMIAPFPSPEDYPYDEAAEKELTLVMEVINTLRNIRGENSIKPGVRLPAVLIAAEESSVKLLENHRVHIEALGKVGSLEIRVGGAAPEKSAVGVVSGVEVHVPLGGLVDFAEELKRLEKENTKLEKDLTIVQKKLANDEFLNNAPPDVVEKEKSRHDELIELLEAVRHHIERVRQYI